MKRLLCIFLFAVLVLGCESSNDNFVFQGDGAAGAGATTPLTLTLPGTPPAGTVTARVSFFGPVTARAEFHARGTLLEEREFPVGDFPITLQRPNGTDSLSCEFLDGDKKVLGLFFGRLDGDTLAVRPEPAAPFYTGVSLVVPDSTLELNQSVQLEARATTPFGQLTVTELANWSSSSASVLVSNQAGTRGRATGQSVGNAQVTGTLTFSRPNLFVSDEGRIAAYRNGTLLYSFFAYPDLEQRPTVAAGDVNGDGFEDIVTAPSTGQPLIRVFNGKTTAPLASFFAFGNSFQGGVTVAVGNVSGDASGEIIVGAAGGNPPVVRVFNSGGNQLGEFFAYDQTFTGGVRVSAADVNGDGTDDIITGPATGGGQVKVFDGSAPQLGGSELASFFAFPGFNGGIFVAGGDVNGDTRDDIIVGSGSGEPRVRVFDGATSNQLFDFQPFDGFTGGVRVGSADVNGDGRDDIVAGGDQIFFFDGINGDPIAGPSRRGPSELGTLSGLRPDISAPGTAILSVGGSTPPTATLSSNIGLAGQQIQINGTNFVDGSTEVKFGTEDGLNVNVISPSQLEVVVPPLTGPPVVDIVVEVDGSAPVTLPGAFGYIQRLTSPDPQPVAHFGGTFDLAGGPIIGGKCIALGNFDGVNGLDLAIAEPRATANSQPSAGRVHIFYNDGQGRYSTPGLTLQPFNAPFALGGFSLAAGDIDNDGQTDDLLVGGPGVDQVALYRGVFNNQAFMAPAFAGATVGGANSRFGSSLAIGNLDGDDALEIVVGSPFSALFGAQSGLVEFYDNDLTRLEGFSGGAGSRRGQSLLLGDSNNDNVDDSYEAAPGQGGDQGQIELRPGTGTNPRFTGASLVFGPPGGGERGFSMSLGSTRPDLAVGNPRSTVSGQNGAGLVEIFFSDGAGGEAGRTTLQSPSPATDAGFGAFLAFADLIAAGSRDLVIAEPFAQVGANTQAGLVRVFRRTGVDQLVLDRTVTSPNPEEGAEFGHSVVTGDVNGDGFDDIIIGSPNSDFVNPPAPNTERAGEVYVIYSPRP